MHQDNDHAEDEQNHRVVEKGAGISAGAHRHEKQIHQQHTHFKVTLQTVHGLGEAVGDRNRNHRNKENIVLRHCQCGRQPTGKRADGKTQADSTTDVGQMKFCRGRVMYQLLVRGGLLGLIIREKAGNGLY